MTNDLYLVIGLVVLALTIPSIVGAFVDHRVPRAAAIMVLIGGGLIALAVTQQPGGYRIEEIPDVFVRVVGRLLH